MVNFPTLSYQKKNRNIWSKYVEFLFYFLLINKKNMRGENYIKSQIIITLIINLNKYIKKYPKPSLGRNVNGRAEKTKNIHLPLFLHFIFY